MSAWTLELGTLPVVSLNQRRHWAERHRDTSTWRETVGWKAKAAGIPRLERPTVTLRYVAPDRRRRDPDNLVPCLKAALDGLRDADVLADDTAADVNALMPRIDPPERGTPGSWYLVVKGEPA